MNYLSKYQIYVLKRSFTELVFVVTLFLAVFLTASTGAIALVPPDVKTITIEAAQGISLSVDSTERTEVWRRFSGSRVLNTDNVRKIAMDFLNSKLDGKIRIAPGYGLSDDRRSTPPSTLMLRLDYTIWPQIVDGKSLYLGAIALNVQPGLNVKHNQFTDATWGWQPEEPFVVGNSDAETQKSLESAISRLLDRYAVIRNPK